MKAILWLGVITARGTVLESIRKVENSCLRVNSQSLETSSELLTVPPSSILEENPAAHRAVKSCHSVLTRLQGAVLWGPRLLLKL